MILTRFEASGFRNLESLVFEPDAALNVLSGPNGAGKSSAIEAIQCLANGHTFRTRQARDYLRHGGEGLTLAARLLDPRDGREHRCGLHRDASGTLDLRVDYEPAQSISDVARLMPVKALTPDSHRLIQDGPEERRRFVDWGCFHRFEAFAGIWKRYRRALSQRNETLRTRGSDDEVRSWNAALASDGSALHRLRLEYVSDLALHVKKRSQVVDFPFHMELEMRSGWPDGDSLEDALEARLETHRRLRTTADGPHRADLAIRADNRLARPMLSRGQQKILVYLLHLAQLDCQSASGDRRAIVLCDDLVAELDSENAERILEQLRHTGAQLFITAAAPLPAVLQPDRLEGAGRWWRVDRGTLV